MTLQEKQSLTRAIGIQKMHGYPQFSFEIPKPFAKFYFIRIVLNRAKIFYCIVFYSIVTFKYIHELEDYNFNILKNSDIHSYNTRRKNDFRLPRVRTNYGKKTLLYQGIKEWNLLEQSFKDINSFLIFKQRIKERVIS